MTQQTHRSALEQALESPGCDRLKDFYRVGPIQRANVECFIDAIASLLPTPPTDRALVEQLVGALEDAHTMLGHLQDRKKQAAALTAGRAALAQTQGETIPFSGADENPPVFGRRWSLAADGFGLQRDDLNGRYVDIDDALSVLHATNPQASEPAVQWCKQCGEGVTDFCRSKGGTCAYGFQRPGKASEPVVTQKHETNLLVSQNQVELTDKASEPVGINGLTEAETGATMSVRGLSEPAPSTEGERTYPEYCHSRGLCMRNLPGQICGCNISAQAAQGERADVVSDLQRAAIEIASAGHAGWGNICQQAAALLQSDARSVGEMTDEQIAKFYEQARYTGFTTKETYTNFARAILASAKAQPSKTAQAGWKLVPIEPTKEMWDAVNKLDDEMAAGGYDGKGCSIEQAWNCMIEAAPTEAAHGIGGKP